MKTTEGHDTGSVESWLVSAGRDRSPGSPLNVPPTPASNFVLGDHRAYSRDDGTPSWEALEEIVGGLEGGSSVAFASGTAAIAAIFDQLPVGAVVGLPHDCYHGVAGLALAGQHRGRWTVRRLAVEDTARFSEWTTPSPRRSINNRSCSARISRCSPSRNSSAAIPICCAASQRYEIRICWRLSVTQANSQEERRAHSRHFSRYEVRVHWRYAWIGHNTARASSPSGSPSTRASP
jgi:hypothetical protein